MKGSNMKREEMRQFLKENLLNCKKDGLRVFINKDSSYVYGLITNGTDIIYVETGGLFHNLFITSFEYVPSKKNGSACSTIENGYGYTKLTKAVFEEAVFNGRKQAAQYGAKLYKNIDEFLDDKFNRNHYVEL